MSKLTILEYPDPRLRTRAMPVTVFDAALQQLSRDMLETMYAAPGIGLAATQVNVHRRMLVLDVSEERNHPKVFVNPEITEKEGSDVSQEGCLSVPGFYFPRMRYPFARVTGRDAAGREIVVEGDGLMAQALQHETDHLDGKLYIEGLEPDIKREAMRAVRSAEWFRNA